jgi:hypothetical protein
MTTLIRVQPPAAPPSYIGPDTTSSYGAIPSIARNVTFEPLSASIITEMIGFATLGLSELGVTDAFVAANIYKWHTWLLRMNEWLKENRKVYPQFMKLPAVQVPANLYFLGTVRPDDHDAQLAKAATAPLGPLLPADKNTLINAMTKGIKSSGKDEETISNTVRDFTQFVRDLNRIATYAIEPHKDVNYFIEPGPKSAVLVKDTLVSPPVADLGHPVVLPPVVKHRAISAKAFGDKIESFMPHSFKRKMSKSSFKVVPVWFWMILLALILYYLMRNNEAGTRGARLGGSSGRRLMSLGPIPEMWSR